MFVLRWHARQPTSAMGNNKWAKQQHAMAVKDQQNERKHAKQISAVSVSS